MNTATDEIARFTSDALQAQSVFASSMPLFWLSGAQQQTDAARANAEKLADATAALMRLQGETANFWFSLGASTAGVAAAKIACAAACPDNKEEAA